MEIIERLKEIGNFKEMIKSWTVKELRTRYKGSFLGFLWTFANPLLQVIVYSLIFPFIMKSTESNYTMFLFTALVPWNYFTNAIQGSTGLFVYNSSLVTKVYFPREVLPISFALSGLMNMIFTYLIVFPMLILFRVKLTWNILWLPVLMISMTIFCLGINLFMSSVNVFFRDIEYAIGIIVMAMYFLTPIMYDISAIPQKYHRLLLINPMTGYVIMFRQVTFYGDPLNLKLFAYSLLYSVVVLIIGYATFLKLQRRFAEVL